MELFWNALEQAELFDQAAVFVRCATGVLECPGGLDNEVSGGYEVSSRELEGWAGYAVFSALASLAWSLPVWEYWKGCSKFRNGMGRVLCIQRSA
jgi:hypothetical protein